MRTKEPPTPRGEVARKDGRREGEMEEGLIIEVINCVFEPIMTEKRKRKGLEPTHCYSGESYVC